MSIRPNNTQDTPTVEALTEWPKAPKSLNRSERKQWDLLGLALLPMRVVSASDLLLVARAAQVMSIVCALLADPNHSPPRLASMMRLELDLWKQLGLSPNARRGVNKAGKGKESSKYDDL